MEKSEKKAKKRKRDLNFASLCFASKQKLLNRSEAKNLKQKKAKKKRKKCEKMRKIAKKSEKNEKKRKIDLNFASLRSENYSSEAKRKI